MDVLSEVLRWFRVEASSVGRVELTPPWGYVVPKRDSAWFHVVMQGSCVLTREQEPALELGTGDYELLPHGSQHTLSNDGAIHSITLDAFMREAENITPSNGGNYGCEAVRVGGGGQTTTLFCGNFEFKGLPDHPLLSLLPEVIHIPADGKQASVWLKAALQILKYEICTPELGTSSAVDRLMDLIFIHTLRTWIKLQPQETTGWLGALCDPVIGKSLLLIHQRPEENWTLEKLARAVAISRSGFAQRFRSLVGESPHRYLTRWRMQMAAILMRGDPGLRVAPVAWQVGFESEASFSAVFKRHFEMSPAQWRRQFAKATSRTVEEAFKEA
ncbi:MAG: AraC family transcriptional regulator [Caldithrix sp.]|nr:MAG: AraC family transcriptional regulator [Caldithrix sp.]